MCGQPEERKYDWSNLPAAATVAELAGYAHRRHAVEQFHEAAKGEPGRHRRTLPTVHREVARWLRHQALLW
jgi:hypothetical protein